MASDKRLTSQRRIGFVNKPHVLWVVVVFHFLDPKYAVLYERKRKMFKEFLFVSVPDPEKSADKKKTMQNLDHKLEKCRSLKHLSSVTVK